MNGFTIPSPVIEAIGWTLLHSLWQGGAIGLLAWATLTSLRRRSATARYAVAVLLMGAIPSAALTTLTIAWRNASVNPRPTAVAAGIEAPSRKAETRQPTEAPLDAGGVARLPDGSAVSRHSAMELATSPRPTDTDGTGSPLALSIEPWLPWLVAAWMAGAVASAGRLLVGWWIVRRLRTDGTSPVPPAVAILFERLKGTLRLRRSVTLLQSSLARGPMVIGSLRPVVLAPIGVLTGLSAPELEAILAHELVHVRRHDALVNAAQVVLEAIFFYHPAVWWLSRTIREERENCCDDAAAQLLGNRLRYGRALLALEELRHPAPVSSLVLAAHGGSLLARIQRLAGAAPQNQTSGGTAAAGLAIGIALLAGSLWWMSVARPQPEPMPTEATATAEKAVPAPAPLPPPAEDDFVVLGDVLEMRHRTPIAEADVTLSLPRPNPRPRPFDLVFSEPHKQPVEYRPLTASWYDDQQPIWSQTYRSDAKGRIEIRIPRAAVDDFEAEWSKPGQTPIPAGRLIAVTARGPGHLPIRPGVFISAQRKSASGSDHTCSILMERSVPIRGRFLTPEGQPAANLPVMIAGNRDGFGDSTGRGFWTRTDAAGRFTLETAEDWPQRLHWFPDEFASDSRAITQTFGDQGDIFLRRGARLSGVIEDTQGKPLAGIAIKATTGTRVPHRYVKSDEQGRFAFPPLPVGDYSLQPVQEFVDSTTGDLSFGLLPELFVPLNHSLTADGGTTAVIRPCPVRQVRFRVVDANGKPVEGRKIRASYATNRAVSRPAQGEPGTYVLAAPDGDRPFEYYFELDPSKEAITYQQAPHQPRVPGRLATWRPRPGTVPDVVIQLLEGAGIAVTVRRADGSPLGDGTECSIHYVGEEEFPHYGVERHPISSYFLDAARPTTTASGFAPGHPLTVRVSSPGFPQQSQTVTLQPGELKSLDIVLEKPLRK